MKGQQYASCCNLNFNLLKCSKSEHNHKNKSPSDTVEGFSLLNIEIIEGHTYILLQNLLLKIIRDWIKVTVGRT